MKSTSSPSALALLATLLATLTLPACATTNTGATKEQVRRFYCTNAAPWRYSRSDTLDSQQQAIANNAVYDSICS